ncbi:histidine kinase [Cohnella xylanilytica]|uniref:histidine kinase n=1 Tax=Cohnella xylanilytica TaxID=557555 RepID=A0A841TWD0_9BACL|nr:histidine kinase [Cohnella xylanilytica]MBB6691322.1 histidine kinase [Cohnella xylanilytica]
MSSVQAARVPKVRSLRRTLVAYLMIGCLIPLLFVCLLTYSSISSILTGKIQTGIGAGLKQEADRLENALNNLDFASKQFALDGQIVDELSAYLQERKIYRKSQLMDSINAKMNLVNFTNPYLGLTAYILPDASDSVLFSNLSMERSFDAGKLPLFVEKNGAKYYGPHKTMYYNSNNLVFSEIRSVQVQGERQAYIYLETNYDLFVKVLSRQSYGMNVVHLLVSQQGTVTAVENERLPDSVLEAVRAERTRSLFRAGDYHLFRYVSPQGWQLVAAVPESSFNGEIYSWIRKMIVLGLSTLVFAALLAFLIWKQVYRPLRKVNVEIVRLAENRTSPVAFTQVEEFDFVLSNFQTMKDKVNELIAAVARNEKQKSRFEIEKLLSQINPHFLHNTLNTVQWLARMNGQKEIDKLVTLLVKVLHYNLGKTSLIVTVRDEIDAMSNYMELQRIRYDYEFEFHVIAEEEILRMPVPRFLLQPLVENAIYHGLSERNGRIEVSVVPSGPDHALLKVEDNGAGLDPQEIARLLSEENEGVKRRGMGIGLSYVNGMLRRFYGEGTRLMIESEPGRGTSVSIRIPRRIADDLEEERLSG